MSISLLNGLQGQQDQIITAMQDGSVAFIGIVNLKMTRALPGVLASSSLQMTLSSSANLSIDPCIPLAVEPETGNLVTMSGHPSTLQFIAASSDDAQVMQIEVVPSNRVSRPDELPLEQARVEHVCFSSHREWMATADRKASGEFSLKIWQWSKKGQTYVVNTRIEEPHGQGAQVTALSFSPRSYASLSDVPLLLSAGTDNRCRIWRCIAREEKRQRIRYWVARSTFDRRGLNIRSFALSLDGSLIAVAHENCVSLWDPETNIEVHSVPLPLGTSISPCSIVFLSKNGGRYLALMDETSLTVIDAVQGEVKYVEKTSDAVGIVALASSGQNTADLALVVSEGGAESKILLRSIDADPCAQVEKSFSVPFAISKVLQATPESGDDKLRFFAMTANYDVVFVSEETSGKRAGSEAERLQSTGRQRLRTIYDELLGPIRQEDAAIRPPRQTRRTQQKQDLGSLFAVPSHLLPPAHLLFETFMQTALPVKSTQADTESEHPHANGEVDKDDQQAAKNESSILTLPSDGKRMADIAALDLSDVANLFADMAVSQLSPNGEVIGNGAVKVANGDETLKGTPKALKKDKKARTSKSGEEPSVQASTPISAGKAGRKRKNSNI